MFLFVKKEQYLVKHGRTMFYRTILFSQIKQSSRGNLTDGAGDEYETWLRSRQPMKPDDQLELTETELSEEITKVLQTENTNYSKNLVIYSFKDGGFVNVAIIILITILLV